MRHFPIPKHVPNLKKVYTQENFYTSACSPYTKVVAFSPAPWPRDAKCRLEPSKQAYSCSLKQMYRFSHKKKLTLLTCSTCFVSLFLQLTISRYIFTNFLYKLTYLKLRLSSHRLHHVITSLITRGPHIVGTHIAHLQAP